MKYIKILVFTFLLFAYNLGFSQVINLETVTYSIVPKEDGKVLLNYNEPTTMRVNFTVSRPLGGNWPNVPIKGEIRLGYYNKITDTDHYFDIINVSNSDWIGPEHAISKVISKDIIMPAGVVNLANPELNVWTYWRFYKEGYPYPFATNGWTDWLNKGYTAMKINPNKIPTTTFNGPTAVCGEGIYTITNPYAISLVNAEGKATLTALGNNQWKVTRVGNANGSVILRSASSVLTQDFPIKLGADKNAGSFRKPPINNTGVYAIRFIDSQNDFDLNSITWTIRSTTNNVTLQNITGNIVNVVVNSWNNTGQNSIILTFNATSNCGETITRDLNIGPGSEILDPDV